MSNRERVTAVSEKNSPQGVTQQSDESIVDPKLLELLVCPLTKTRLIYNAQTKELISKAAGVAFPIRKGIPLMTPDAARQLDGDEK